MAGQRPGLRTLLAGTWGLPVRIMAAIAVFATAYIIVGSTPSSCSCQASSPPSQFVVHVTSAAMEIDAEPPVASSVQQPASGKEPCGEHERPALHVV